MPLPPLILIHGYPFDHTMWNGVVSLLANKTKIITPDLPGFGDNPSENTEPSIDVMADDVAELFEFHHLTRAVVAGMSMGGYVALSLAERHKERVAGLGLISTQAAADTAENQTARRALIAKVRAEGTQAAADALLPKLFGPANATDAAMKQVVIDGAANAGVEGICWALEAMAQRPDRTALLKILRIPSLVLHGKEDKLIPAERARNLSGLMQDAKYVELPDVGHASPMESPQAVADALLDLLQRSNRPGGAVGDHNEHARTLPAVTWAPTERGL